LITLNFPEGTGVWFPEEKSFISHYEALYPFMELGSIEQDRMCQVPVLFTTGDGVRIGLSETDLYDYPGLFLKKANGNTMNGVFPPKPAKIVENVPWGDRSEKIEEVEAYIAKTEGTRNFPWRTFIITDHDADLLESNLNFLLARESDGQDFSWVKPGMVAWDWYNANNVFHVDFKAGINNDTYKYYIDFASKYGVDYIILDEGWSETTVDIKTCKEDIDVEELVKYGAERKVGIILWVLWKPLDKDMENIMKKYAEWGVKGIKVDFMQRADQDMVNYYERTVATAAKYKLMVDFHGAYKPAGLRRAYPNLLTYEGVKGNENNKWTDIINPEHTLILPFTRMLAGPMDFTPGSMRNSHLKNYKISFERPMSLGTRTHQVAMYVVYESPLQMMCESPTIYYQERETAAFIASIPVTWDETRVLDAKVGEYILIARRNGNEWYIGAMTNSEKRNLEVDLGFLPEGKYIMQAYSDGVNADRNAEDYKLEKLVIESGQKLKIELAEGGGWCSSLRKE